MPAGRRAGGFAAQADAGHADAQLQAQQVMGLVHGGVVAAGVGDQSVFLEAAARVVAVGRQRHVRPSAGHGTRGGRRAPARTPLPPVRDDAGCRRPRAARARQVVHAAGREVQAGRRGLQARRVGHGGHLDGALGAIQEAVEHLRIEVAGGHHLCGEAVVRPDRVGRGSMEFRQVRVPLPAAMTSKPQARAQSTISQISAGWSP